jgi:hypothetical protein
VTVGYVEEFTMRKAVIDQSIKQVRQEVSYLKMRRSIFSQIFFIGLERP